MSLTPAGVDEMVTLAIENRAADLRDNISDNNVFLMKIKEKGRNRPWGGGHTIREELEFAENSTTMWYSGYDTLNITPQTVFTHADFTPKQAAIVFTMSGLEMLVNSGKEAIIDLAASRLQNAEKSFVNFMGTGVYSDGTGASGKQIVGLQALVSDAGTGTVGGLNSSAYTWWQNVVYDFSAASVTPSSSTIQTAMKSVLLSVTRGNERPDLCVADNTYFTYFWDSLTPNQRFADEKIANAGFQTFKFAGIDVVADGGKGGNCPANHMYLLNCDYFSWREHPQRKMKVIGGERQPLNQDAILKVMAWAGALTCSNRSMQAVIVP